MRRWHQRPEIGAAIFLGSSLPVALRAPVSTDPKKIAKHQTQSTLHQCRTPQKFTMSVPLTLRLECSVNAETPPMMLDFLPMARLLAFLPDRAPCAFMWLRAARAAQSTILRETGRLKFSHLV